MIDLTDKNQYIIKVVDEACCTVPELEIPKAELVEVWVWKLATGVRDTCIELERVQLELNLKIVELQLKPQPSTLPEIEEQHETAVKYMLATVESALKDYTTLFEQSLEVVTYLQEDPMV